MIFKKIKLRLEAAENRIGRLEEQLGELTLIKSKGISDTSAEEITCAQLIDEWVNGGKEE